MVKLLNRTEIKRKANMKNKLKQIIFSLLLMFWSLCAVAESTECGQTPCEEGDTTCGGNANGDTMSIVIGE